MFLLDESIKYIFCVSPMICQRVSVYCIYYLRSMKVLLRIFFFTRMRGNGFRNNFFVANILHEFVLDNRYKPLLCCNILNGDIFN